MPRFRLHPTPWPLALADRPSALPYEPVDPGCDYIRKGLLNLAVYYFAVFAVGGGHGQRNNRRLGIVVLAIASERHVAAVALGEPWRERCIHGFLDLRHRTEA